MLRQARPNLSKVSPVGALATLGFGIFNLLLGATLFLGYTTTGPTFFIVNEVLTYQVWGTLFVLTGVVMLVAYKINSWEIIRKSTFFALFIKLWWLSALIGRQIGNDHDNFLFLICWAIITYLQMLTYIFLMPTIRIKK